MKKYINLRGELFDLSEPRVMGILNVTPDSFYVKSRSSTAESVLYRVEEMVSQGVDIIDLGGYSSRPGAAEVSMDTEIERITEALSLIRRSYPDIILSLDTFRSEVARIGIEEFKVDIINDISGGSIDRKMHPLIAEKGVPYILMHMRGTPESMQNDTHYDDIITDLKVWFSAKLRSLTLIGVKDIILDPGFGFGKNTDQNFQLLRQLGEFEIFGLPILGGLSRKSMIWKTLGVTPEDSLPGTTSLNTIALSNGANILRVHDVAEAVQTVKLFSKTFPS